MSHSSDYWGALAPHHSSLENNYFDLSGLRRIIHDIHQPVLVVGAGQGLIVEELLKNGFQTDGVDLSSEMIRYAKTRRGLTLIEADAKALPFGEGTYGTIIYATGVVDFMGDEEQIRVILNEARRTIRPSGKIFVAFYKMSAASEEFLARLGLLGNVSLVTNASGLFECRWVRLRVETSHCLFLQGMERLDLPVAHGQGRVVVPKEELALLLERAPLRYCENPNGSVADIAGVCNPAGNVFGLMPHPERYLTPQHHPAGSSNPVGRKSAGSPPLGLTLFQNAVRYVREVL